MKIKKKYVMTGLGLLFLTIAFWGFVYHWFTSRYTVTVVAISTQPCYVGSEKTKYQFATVDGSSDISCNTEDLQQATATLADGSTYSFFLEYNSDGFVSWSAPDTFTCNQATWTNDPPTIEGVMQLTDKPDVVGISCNDDLGHALLMQGYLPVP